MAHASISFEALILHRSFERRLLRRAENLSSFAGPFSVVGFDNKRTPSSLVVLYAPAIQFLLANRIGHNAEIQEAVESALAEVQASQLSSEQWRQFWAQLDALQPPPAPTIPFAINPLK